MTILSNMNVAIFVLRATTAVTVEEMTGTGMMMKQTSTAAFHQETISVPKLIWEKKDTKLTARQEYYYPGPNHAMVPVLAVQ